MTRTLREVGLGASVAASAACAPRHKPSCKALPTINWDMVMRVVWGMGGRWGLEVASRSVREERASAK